MLTGRRRGPWTSCGRGPLVHGGPRPKGYASPDLDRPHKDERLWWRTGVWLPAGRWTAGSGGGSPEHRRERWPGRYRAPFCMRFRSGKRGSRCEAHQGGLGVDGAAETAYGDEGRTGGRARAEDGVPASGSRRLGEGATSCCLLGARKKRGRGEAWFFGGGVTRRHSVYRGGSGGDLSRAATREQGGGAGKAKGDEGARQPPFYRPRSSGGGLDWGEAAMAVVIAATAGACHKRQGRRAPEQVAG
jgi:hypothetical protein